MKKITIEQAFKLIEEKKAVKARITSRDVIVVRTSSKLNDLIALKKEGVQDLELFEITVNKDLPDDCIEVSLDEAMQLINEGENEIYGRTEDSDQRLETRNALIQYYRKSLLHGEPCIYWKG